MQAQSFISTLMCGHMGLYESRILMRIVERCQVLLPGSTYKPTIYQVPGGWSYQFAFTLSSLTKSHNYRYIKAACEVLKNITVSRYDGNTGQWCLAGLITQARIDEHSGVLRVEVADWVCQNIIDFRRGWRQYDIDQALCIRNPYALRLYLITCTQNTRLNFSIGRLRDLLLGEHSTLYPNNGDFIRHTLMPAQKELAKLGLNGFTFEVSKGTGADKGRIQKVALIPIKREGNGERNISEVRKDIAKEIPQQLLDYLTLHLRFSTHELTGKNLVLLSNFTKIPGWQNLLTSMVDRMRRHMRGHGWLINAIKMEVNEHETD